VVFGIATLHEVERLLAKRVLQILEGTLCHGLGQTGPPGARDGLAFLDVGGREVGLALRGARVVGREIIGVALAPHVGKPGQPGFAVALGLFLFLALVVIHGPKPGHQPQDKNEENNKEFVRTSHGAG